MTNWHDPSTVAAESCSFVFLASEETSTYVARMAVALIKLIHVLGGIYM